MTGRATTIRPATPVDQAAVHVLAAELATTFAVTGDGFRRTFAEVLSSGGATLLVAESGGEVGGYLLGFVHPAFFADGRVGWIEELLVRPELRRQGVGASLVRAFEVRAGEAGARVVALATRRAADFYRSVGYVESAVYFRKPL
ncbi:GNAT family N-acetyltransferase [Pseudonocardia nematodicida]|uniref:GNAT family N-acetyltransferase n=1 Tax=Pseudonocardia nematodicida TaxID=1206997 RepID=A0ABV1KJR6_9PSEU